MRTTSNTFLQFENYRDKKIVLNNKYNNNKKKHIYTLHSSLYNKRLAGPTNAVLPVKSDTGNPKHKFSAIKLLQNPNVCISKSGITL